MRSVPRKTIATGRNQLAKPKMIPLVKSQIVLSLLIAIYKAVKAKKIIGISDKMVVLCPQLLGYSEKSMQAMMATLPENSFWAILPMNKAVKALRIHRKTKSGYIE